MGSKLYVGNLPFDLTSGELKAHFEQAGVCTSASIITDRATGQSRGFGFVEMGSSAEAQQAIQQLDGSQLKGRNIRVSEAREQQGGGRGRGGSGGDRRPGRRS